MNAVLRIGGPPTITAILPRGVSPFAVPAAVRHRHRYPLAQRAASVVFPSARRVLRRSGLVLISIAAGLTITRGFTELGLLLGVQAVVNVAASAAVKR